MAVVDAAVGIKTAVNFHEKKNKLGTYQPPLGVLYDTAFLSSLEDRHVSNGSAEVLKMACIKDAPLFELLAASGKDLIANKFQVRRADGCGAGQLGTFTHGVPHGAPHGALTVLCHRRTFDLYQRPHRTTQYAACLAWCVCTA